MYAVLLFTIPLGVFHITFLRCSWIFLLKIVGFRSFAASSFAACSLISSANYADYARKERVAQSMRVNGESRILCACRSSHTGTPGQICGARGLRVTPGLHENTTNIFPGFDYLEHNIDLQHSHM